MPGLPKRQSYELLHDMYGHHEPGITGLPPLPKPSAPQSMADGIKYIPPQMDPLAGTSTRAARQSPIRLLIQDAGVLITMLPYLPNVFLPFKARDPSNELYLNLLGARDMVLQSWLLIMETVLLVLAVPALLLLPGIVSMTAIALCSLTVYLISKPMEGPRVAYSNMNDATLAVAEQHRDERWLFVNGCATGHSGLQKNIDRIAETFARAVIGIHNKTYGLPADIVECLVQRCFSYQTMDVRVTHSYVKATLLDPTVSKVVLIGHSQGGIIISLVLDQLFTELPVNCLSKLEIYTFGSAASHFSNPLLSLSGKTDANNIPLSPTKVHFDRPTAPKHLISHIEHYANERDMVPRWGVLHCVQNVLNNRYSGSVFVRMGASGHMFNQHYMDALFPLPENVSHRLEDSFFDKRVEVDEKLAVRRESTAVSNMGHMRRKSGLEFGDGQIIPDDPDMSNGNATNGINGTGDAVMTFARTDTGRLLAKEAQGKTVRELSRLWRYQNGRSPHTPTPFPTMNSEDRWLSGKGVKNGKIQGLAPLKVHSRDNKSMDGAL